MNETPIDPLGSPLPEDPLKTEFRAAEMFAEDTAGLALASRGLLRWESLEPSIAGAYRESARLDLCLAAGEQR